MLTLAVVLPDTGTVIGDVVLKWICGKHRQGEIGYMFHPVFGGKGYATEAATVLTIRHNPRKHQHDPHD